MSTRVWVLDYLQLETGIAGTFLATCGGGLYWKNRCIERPCPGACCADRESNDLGAYAPNKKFGEQNDESTNLSASLMVHDTRPSCCAIYLARVVLVVC